MNLRLKRINIIRKLEFSKFIQLNYKRNEIPLNSIFFTKKKKKKKKKKKIIKNIINKY